MHDRSFIVAGATKADLLADLQAAVDKAIAQGTGKEAFEKEFRKIVADRGWTGWTGEDWEGGIAWRAGVIWDTNMTTSYAAGRYAQLTDPELLARRPYWKYIHADGVIHPRVLHEEWGNSGLTLRHDHPFWKTNYPPNGFGCHCRVIAVKTPGEGDATEPPEGWNKIDAKTGRLPGVDKGWDYAPGASVADELRKLVAEKAAALPEPLARDFLAQAEKVGIVPSVATLVVSKVAKTEADAMKWLMVERKTEYGIAYDATTGKEISRYTSNSEDIVGLPAKISAMLNDRSASVVLLHNHPNATSLSAEDLTLLLRPGAKKVVACGYPRSWFAATKGTDIGRLEKVIEAAKMELVQQIYLLAQRGLHVPGMATHLRNLALDRAGIIRYEFSLDPIRSRLYSKEKAALDAAVEEITWAIKRVRP
jgi:hypothetical protein